MSPRLWPLALWCALPVGALLLVWPSADPGFGAYHLPKECWLAALAVPLWWLASKRTSFDAMDAAAGGWAAVVMLSAAFSDAGALTVRQAGLAVVGLALFAAARRAETRPWVESALLTAAAMVAAVALAEALGALPGLSGSGRAPGATLGQRNTVGHLCALCLPLALQQWTTSSGRRRVLSVLVVLLLAGAVVVTRSRAAWLGVGVGAVAFCVVRRTARPLLLLAPALGLALLVPTRLSWKSATPYQDTAATLLDAHRGSGKGRLVQAEASLGLWRQSPVLGVGPGAWASRYLTVSPPHDPTVSRVSLQPVTRLVTSDVLAVWVEQGVLGTLAALLFLGTLFRRLRTRGEAAALAMLAVLLTLSLFDAVSALPSGLMACALALGLAAGPPSPEAKERPWPRWLVSVVLAAFAVLAGLRWAAFVTRHGPAVTWADAERALALSPDDLEARLSLTESYVLEERCEDAAPHLRWLTAHLAKWPRVEEWRKACPSPLYLQNGSQDTE